MYIMYSLKKIYIVVVQHQHVHLGTYLVVINNKMFPQY